MNRFFILLLAATTCLLGCDKSYEKFEPDDDSDTLWASDLATTLSINNINQNLELEPLIDSVSTQNGGIISFPNNITVTFPANAFSLNGSPFTDGKAMIKFLLITKKGDMVRMCLPSQSNGYLLESGGEIYLEASNYGKILSLVPGKQIIIDYKSSSSPNSLMKGFSGVKPINVTGPYSCFNWILDDTNIKVSTTSDGYQVITNNLNWINSDYFNDTAATKTTVALTMPINFTNTNTYTFIVYKNSNSVMQFDADASNKIWVKNNVPINKQVVFISISKLNGNYYLGISDSYTTNNQHVVLKPSKQTLQDILSYLSSL